MFEWIHLARTILELDHLWGEFASWQECECLADDDLLLVEEVLGRVMNQKLFIRRRWNLEDADLEDGGDEGTAVKTETNTAKGGAPGVLLHLPPNKTEQ